MGKKFDIVVAGGGHNGLATAAYLAKAGLNVCVVEKQDIVGGGCVTREYSEPGFKHDHCGTWHGFIQANPLIQNDELGLFSKYGLKYVFPEIFTSVIFPDDRCMNFYRDIDKTCESIAQFSAKDAEAYRKFYEWSLGMLDMFTAGMFVPPPSYGAFASLLDQSEEGRELLRASMLSGLDIVNEWFENEYVRMAMCRFVSEGNQAPQTKGTGLVLFLFVPMSHKYGGGTAIGGSSELSNALAQCVEEHGGTIRVECPVERFKITGGEVSGVILEDGEEILASKGVVSSLNVKQMFPDMVEGADLPEGFVKKIRRIHESDFCAMRVHYCLHEAPKYISGGDADKAIWVELAPDNMEEFLRGYEDFRYGIPSSKFPIAITNTLYDKTRAPEGKHTLYLYHFEPYDLKDGGAAKWDEIGEKVAEDVMAELRKHTTNMGDENIIGKPDIATPLDIERYNPAMYRGDVLHSALMIAHQSGGNRPIAGYSGYKMPIKNLYLTGASAAPGGGISCGSGRAASMVIMEDLGIDFEKIIS